MPTSRRHTALAALLLAVLVALGACSDGAEEIAAEPTTPPSTAPTTTAAPTTTTTAVPAYVSQVAIPLADGELAVYEAPEAPEPARTLTHPRLINGDPNAAVPLVLLVKERAGDWLEVYLPVRPNGSTGWVRASDVRLEEHDYRVEVELASFTLRVFKADEVIFEAPVGVAKENSPTPGGLCYTTELIRPPDAPSGPYGTYAYGLSGFSETYTTFNGGPGQLGIHGTNRPELIGQQVSSGCIRLNNDDVDVLAEEIGLPLGVPVVVLTGDELAELAPDA